MGFSRQEYWSGLSFPSPGDLPDPGIETECSAPPALVGNVLDDSLLIHEWTPLTEVQGQGGLACCGSWDRKVSDMTERLN